MFLCNPYGASNQHYYVVLNQISLIHKVSCKQQKQTLPQRCLDHHDRLDIRLYKESDWIQEALLFVSAADCDDLELGLGLE